LPTGAQALLEAFPEHHPDLERVDMLTIQDARGSSAATSGER
jgi:hypothetical protein